MSKDIKQFNSDFKLKVVLKYLSENFTVAQICQDYKISKATLHKWVNQFKIIVALYLTKIIYLWFDKSQNTSS